MSSSRTLLLVDDNHDTLDLLELFLYRDYAVTTALNGFEGLNLAREQRPDCVVTDIMMPVMDGIAFYNHLRRDAETASIPVVAVTSFVKKVASLENLGFDGVVTKPLDREELLKTIHRVLERKAAAQ
jgi:CheY-like chemotaxis protein